MNMSAEERVLGVLRRHDHEVTELLGRGDWEAIRLKRLQLAGEVVACVRAAGHERSPVWGLLKTGLRLRWLRLNLRLARIMVRVR